MNYAKQFLVQLNNSMQFQQEKNRVNSRKIQYIHDIINNYMVMFETENINYQLRLILRLIRSRKQ